MCSKLFQISCKFSIKNNILLILRNQSKRWTFISYSNYWLNIFFLLIAFLYTFVSLHSLSNFFLAFPAALFADTSLTGFWNATTCFISSLKSSFFRPGMIDLPPVWLVNQLRKAHRAKMKSLGGFFLKYVITVLIVFMKTNNLCRL